MLPVLIISTCFYNRSCYLVSSGVLNRGHGGRVVTLSPPISEAGIQFLALYVLVSSALQTTHRDMTCTVLKAT